MNADGDGPLANPLAYNPLTCATGNDCDDSNPLVYKGGVEICDGYDNDCDGVVDGHVMTDPLGLPIIGSGGESVMTGPAECGGRLSCVCPEGPEGPGDPVDHCYCHDGLNP